MRTIIYSFHNYEMFQCFSINGLEVYRDETQNMCFTRNSDEFFTIGSKWTYGRIMETLLGYSVDFIELQPIRDTLIKGFGSKILALNNIEQAQNLIPIIICRDGEQLKYYDNEDFHLLYNFRLSKGDIFEVRSFLSNTFESEALKLDTFRIDSVGNISINGELRRVQFITNVSENPTIDYGPQIIEGIGSIGNHLLPYKFHKNTYNIEYTGFRCYEDAFRGLWQFSDEACNFQKNITNATEERLDFKISIFPNPTQHRLNIVFDKRIDAKIRLFDITGKPIHQAYYSGEQYSINLLPNSKGIYIVNIYTEEGSITKKILKN